MAKRDIAVQSTWRLVKDYGSGPGYVPAGSEVVVTGVYPPGTPGIGASAGPVVLARYARPNCDPQTLAVEADDFHSLFKAV